LTYLLNITHFNLPSLLNVLKFLTCYYVTHHDIVCCAALLELRKNRQVERLEQENPNNVAKNKCEQAVENGEIMQPVSPSDDKSCGDASVRSEQNGDGKIVEIQSATAEMKLSNKDAVTEVTVPACTDIPSRLDQLEETDKLLSSTYKAEQCEPCIPNADQLVCIKLPPDTDREVLQPADRKLNVVQGDDRIDIVDLSNVTSQLSSISSSQHAATVCFEVCFQK